MLTSVAISEQQLLNCIWDNPDLLSRFDRNIFLSSIGRSLFEAMHKIENEGVPFSVNVLLSEGSEKNTGITEDLLISLRQQEYDVNAFDFYLRKLKEKWAKTELSNRILKDILIESESKDEIDLEKFEELSDEIRDHIDMINGIDSPLITVEEMTQLYDDEIERRKRGEHRYSTGDPFLDRRLIVGMLPGQISLFFGATGTGKSAYALSMINLNINQRMPTVYCSLEMDTISTMDRLIAQRMRVRVEELYPNEEGIIDDRILARYEREKERLKKTKSLYFVETPNLSLANVEKIIREARQRFGVGYFKVFIDLLTMVQEFSGGDPKEYEKAMNMLHFLAKKYGVHIIGVVQANRSPDMQNVATIDQIDRLRPRIHHVKNSNALAERSRLVLGVFRPKYYAQRNFPNDPELDLMDDTMEIQILKQSQGEVGEVLNYLFDAPRFLITPIQQRPLATAPTPVIQRGSDEDDEEDNVEDDELLSE